LAHHVEAKPSVAALPFALGGWHRLAERRMRWGEMLALRARLWPLLAALLLALPLGAGGVQYFCHGMGQVVEKCCCSSPATRISTAISGDCGAKLQAPDCCERLERASGDVSTALHDKAGLSGVTPALAEPSPIIVRGSGLVARYIVNEPVEAQARRPRGPPLFLANCSFLT
jgi:hypothetical protein